MTCAETVWRGVWLERRTGMVLLQTIMVMSVRVPVEHVKRTVSAGRVSDDPAGHQ